MSMNSVEGSWIKLSRERFQPPRSPVHQRPAPNGPHRPVHVSQPRGETPGLGDDPRVPGTLGLST